MVAGKTAKRERTKSGKKAGNQIKIKKGAVEIVEFCTLDLSCKKESNSIINQRYALGDFLVLVGWMEGPAGWCPWGTRAACNFEWSSTSGFRCVTRWRRRCGVLVLPLISDYVVPSLVRSDDGMPCFMCRVQRCVASCWLICTPSAGGIIASSRRRAWWVGGLPSVEHIFGSSLSRKNLTQLLCMKTYFRIMIYEAWWVVYLCNLFSRCGIMEFFYEVK